MHCTRRMLFRQCLNSRRNNLEFLQQPAILRMMKTPDNLMADSELYVQIYFSGLIFICIYNIGSAILRAIGDSKRPLII